MSEHQDYLEFVKESFDPRLISALFKNFSNKYIALQELLDNSVDDRVEGKQLIVSILYNQDEGKLSIKNVDGSGMDVEDLRRFFKWGAVGEKDYRIGRYGQGGKAAIGYLAKSFTIKSHPSDSPNGYFIKVDDWEDREKGFKEFKIEPFKMHESRGTVTFEFWNLKKSFDRNTIKSRIAEIYRPLIVNKEVEFTVDGVLVKCPPSNYDPGTKSPFTGEVEVDGVQYRLAGEYGIVSDKNSPRGGFNVYQFGRLITKKEYFGHTDPSKRWNVERLYGELYLNFEVPLLMNKTDVDRDSKVWREIKRIMHQEINQVIREAIDYKTPTKKEQRAVKQIEKKVRETSKRETPELTLANYGSTILYKVKMGDSGESILIINRQHPAYKYWSETAIGKKLYAITIYALYKSAQKLSKSEASRLHKSFSESLIEEVRKLS